MRVLLLHNFLTPYRIPLFEALARQVDLEVWIYGDVASIREWKHKTDGLQFPCRLLPHWNLPTGSRDFRVLLNYTLPRDLARHEHDVTLCMGWDAPASWYAAWQARRTGRPFVLWSGSTEHEPSWRRSLFKPLVKWMVQGADARITYGSRAKEYLVSLGADPETTWPAVRGLPDAYGAGARALPPEARAHQRGALGIDARFVVFYCGQLIDRKGLSELLHAFARFQSDRDDALLVIAGTGSRERTFKALAQRLGIAGRIRWLGHVPPENLPGWYALADLFVLPSREEVWGMVINEALACGVPVLTCEPVGAAPDLIIEGENGYVVPAADSDALCVAMQRHFDSNHDRAAMRARVLEIGECWSLERQVEVIVGALRHAISRDSR